jgi:hypothetical protein
MNKIPEVLKAHADYWELSPIECAEICNGCGTEGWKGKLIPETMYGMCVSEACDIHDHRYHMGGVEKDRTAADKEFRKNIHVIIRRNEWWLRAVRYVRAYIYYASVHNFGWTAFNYKDEKERQHVKDTNKVMTAGVKGRV